MARDNRRINPQSPQAVIPQPQRREIPRPQITAASDIQNQHIAFCFRDIDRNQGATLQEWETANLLPKLVHRIAAVSQQTLQEAKQSSAMRAYNDFPTRSGFRHPGHVTQDAEWAAIHLQGEPVIGGHIEKNIFHVVFLDTHHAFWISNFRDRNPRRRSQQ
jgi:hypothetical protein